MASAFLFLQPSASLWGDYIKTLVMLIGICLLAVGALKFLAPRLQAGRGASSGPISILATQTLEPRKRLYVVRAGNTAMLIATSGDAVHFMTQLDQADFREEQTSSSTAPTPKPIFQKISRLAKERYASE